MGAPKKLEEAVYVTTILERSQHKALKSLAYRQHQPLSEIIREAVSDYIVHKKSPKGPGLMGLLGLGKEIWKNEDAQKYVNKLRSEWADREF